MASIDGAIDKDVDEEVQQIVGKTISKAEGYVNHIRLTFDDGSVINIHAWGDDDDAPLSSHMDAIYLESADA
jgi:hypothetical protein